MALTRYSLSFLARGAVMTIEDAKAAPGIGVEQIYDFDIVGQVADALPG